MQLAAYGRTGCTTIESAGKLLYVDERNENLDIEAAWHSTNRSARIERPFPANPTAGSELPQIWRE